MSSHPSACDPAQYDRFRGERQQPLDDLLALRRPRPGMRVVDLGCGSGELTRRLSLDVTITSHGEAEERRLRCARRGRWRLSRTASPMT